MSDKLQNLISIDQLTKNQVDEIHSLAQKFFVNPQDDSNKTLQNKLLVNFFFENSTRTRISFEIAAKRLGLEVINVNLALSSLKKGESMADMAATINAMNPDFVVIRHNSSGIMKLFEKYFSCHIINAGDGTNEHPTQALLDSFTIRNHKKSLENLKVAICGDVLHSRVARSNIKLLKKFGCKINVITPPTFMPKDFKKFMKNKWDIEVFNDMDAGIKNVNVVMMLRIQQERMAGCYVSSPQEYFKNFGMSHERLKLTDNALVLHPGPINRDVEISSKLADDLENNVILQQVKAGVATRQAILLSLS